jgi:hypothetical protein
MLKRFLIILIGVFISVPIILLGFTFLGSVGVHDILRGMWLYMSLDAMSTFIDCLLNKLYYSKRLKVKEEF